MTFDLFIKYLFYTSVITLSIVIVLKTLGVI